MHQRTEFQLFFEFFLAECNCLVVVVRKYYFELYAGAHEPPAACEYPDSSRCPLDAPPGSQQKTNPASRAIRPCACLNSLVEFFMVARACLSPVSWNLPSVLARRRQNEQAVAGRGPDAKFSLRKN
jgi:hypothetical protein